MLLTKSQLNKASDKDLAQLAEAVKAEVTKRASNTKSELLKKVRKMAQDAGISLNDLLDEKGAKSAARAPRAKAAGATKPRGKVAAKYANPADASQTWTGRGRKPKWVEDALKGGATIESLAINK